MCSRSVVAVAIFLSQTIAFSWIPEQTTCSVTETIVESNILSHKVQHLQEVVSLLNTTWKLGDPEELEFEMDNETYVDNFHLLLFVSSTICSRHINVEQQQTETLFRTVSDKNSNCWWTRKYISSARSKHTSA